MVYRTKEACLKAEINTTRATRYTPARLGPVRDAPRGAFEAALRGLLAEIPTSHAVFESGDDSLLFANPAFFAEFGALPESRASFEQRFEPVSVTAHDSDPGASPAAKADGRRTEVFCPASGRWYVLQWSRLHRPEGGALTLLTAQNLTERMDNVREQRALQEQLLVSSRVMSVGEMATTLAHEINQPLATIINCLTAAETLLERAGAHPRQRADAERLRQTLELAREQAEQAAAVVARIREFVRTRESRREPLCPQARSLSASANPRLATLTRREHQVLELVVAGKFNKAIADVLGISIKTVELHRASVMAKLGVRTLPDLVKVFLGYH